MNDLLQFEDDCFENSLEHILGLTPSKSSSSDDCEHLYDYGTGQEISETYKWAWVDNHNEPVMLPMG